MYCVCMRLCDVILYISYCARANSVALLREFLRIPGIMLSRNFVLLCKHTVYVCVYNVNMFGSLQHVF